ncbi:glycosyltransferase WbsX family protein [Cellulomonas fimi]|uniref:Uncharacterized protein n=1 Tax=Cellulomonas fimi (strain ATCC 484 / DSM 20113 / JCM 1341 / CCUG 24087 / LMG 16345 / NBRC 15513 / NCIMB 8980 / NCTC 7547 / NRS-133) TaxID=590998 RepID=F4GZE2_CELFA|nr:glycoside hydrolase family 99-like domain-containing protein [Cellulomonas fimi]AEE44863.1 hypothetical protein Celf_0723 [Cellulomonas fimi ATCC 484]NNH08098.1 glycoside hydrolase family 99-like domain-containing protein [Cellulomonas fimi]VEH27517.1 Uncharacterised protein [Cellulomonas fimi]
MRTIAFYLPQFHPIPENDQWWGEGFTEWTNVRRARPQFDGHDQPREPGELGHYSLTDHDVLRRQSDLARAHGVDAFCLYFYWFDGRRLLERPVEAWRSDPELLPYCLSWANESWTRRWDGKSRDVLMPQSYQAGFEERLFADLLPHLRAPHYLRQHGAPVLVVHRADQLPDPLGTTSLLRRLAEDAGVGGLHLVAAETKPGLDPRPMGFDAVVEFPPVGSNTIRNVHTAALDGVARDFRGRLMSYEKLARTFATRSGAPFVRYRGVTPGWDNTPRRQERATIYVGSTPELFGAWASRARKAEEAQRGRDGLLFVNAWNEWAEGAYLEPDTRRGLAYLEAMTAGSSVPSSARSRSASGRRTWTRPQLYSVMLAALGSALKSARSVVRHVERLRRGSA